MDGTVAQPNVIDRPELTFPEVVGDWVRELYSEANVILEYGSGGSTVMASEMTGKRIFSVESDKHWCAMMQGYFDANGMTSPVELHHANIGPVGKWGRPKSDRRWRGYHRYPNSVWDREDFKAPDLVLVDGRFRPACFATTMLRTEKPVTLLFDDYVGRNGYMRVEKWFKPVEIRGRMARFEITPNDFPRQDLTYLLSLYTKPF